MTVTTPHLATSGGWTDAQLLHALEEVVEKELNRHLKVAKDWMPHEYVPWSDGRNFPGFFEDGEAWEKEQSKVTPIGRTALIVNLLTETICRATTTRSPRFSAATAPGAPGCTAGPPRRAGTAS